MPDVHVCRNCDWHTYEPEKAVARALAVWHVYRDHPDIWGRLIGDRPPDVPDPRDPAVRAQMSGN